MLRPALLLLSLAFSTSVLGVEKVDSFRELWSLDLEEASGRIVANLKGVASFVRADGFVLAPDAKRDQNAVFVKYPSGGEGMLRVNEGDRLMVDGRTCVWENIPAVEASAVTRQGTEELPQPRTAKWHDVRKGWRNLRRARQYGTVVAIDFEFDNDGACQTLLTLHYWIYDIRVQVAGEVTGDAARVGSEIEVVGITRNIIDENSDVISSFIEVSSPGNVRFIASGSLNKETVILVALTSVASCAALVLLVVWLRGVARSRRMAIIAAERRRMAADLHDSIEQHLAGVKILLTCALKPQGVPEETKKVLEQAAAMLIHAKSEVRSTIMNLRSAGDDKSLGDHFREIASSLRHGGVKAKVLLRGVPERMDAARLGDLLLIVREAVTNAVKHGKAKTVVIVSDPMPGTGGFVLKVLNDGAPFDAASALGPETGHFGLAGMKERASRSGFALAFLTDGKWTVVKVEVPE